MLVATREHEPRVDARPFGPAEPPRSLASRLTGSVQLLGSMVGIPLALIGGYSTWHTTFSPEAKCQALRANIVTMLDKKADASTLRLLVQRDVVTFQRDCAEVDPDAVAAFRNLLVAEKAPAPRHVEPVKAEPAKAETNKAEPAKKDVVKPANVTAKAEPVAKPLPVAKVEAAKPEPKKVQPAPVVVKREPAKPADDVRVVVKREPAKPADDVRPFEAKAAEAKPAVEEPKPSVEAAKPAEVVAGKPDTDHVDAAWVASVRDALRESATRVSAPAETSAEVAAPMPPPIVVPSESQSKLVRVAPANDGLAPPVPPADIPAAASNVERPVPPASIPDTDASQPAAN